MGIFIGNKQTVFTIGKVKGEFGIEDGSPTILSLTRYKRMSDDKKTTLKGPLLPTVNRTKIGSYIRLALIAEEIKRKNLVILEQELKNESDEITSDLEDIKTKATEAIILSKRILYFFKELSRASEEFIALCTAINNYELDTSYLMIASKGASNITSPHHLSNLKTILLKYGFTTDQCDISSATSKMVQLLLVLSRYNTLMISEKMSGKKSNTGGQVGPNPKNQSNIVNWSFGLLPDLMPLAESKNPPAGFWRNTSTNSQVSRPPSSWRNAIGNASQDSDTMNVEAIKILLTAQSRIKNLNLLNNEKSIRDNFQSWLSPQGGQQGKNPKNDMLGMLIDLKDDSLGSVTHTIPPYSTRIVTAQKQGTKGAVQSNGTRDLGPVAALVHPTSHLGNKPGIATYDFLISDLKNTTTTDTVDAKVLPRTCFEAYILPPITLAKKSQFLNYDDLIMASKSFTDNTDIIQQIVLRLNYSHSHAVKNFKTLHEPYNDLQHSLAYILTKTMTMHRMILDASTPTSLYSGELLVPESPGKNSYGSKSEIAAIFMYLFERVALNPNLKLRKSSVVVYQKLTVKKALFDAFVIYDYASSLPVDGDPSTDYARARWVKDTPYYSYFRNLIDPEGPYKQLLKPSWVDGMPLPFPSLNLFFTDNYSDAFGGGVSALYLPNTTGMNQYYQDVVGGWLSQLDKKGYLNVPQGLRTYLEAFVIDILLHHIMFTVLGGHGLGKQVENTDVLPREYSPMLKGYGYWSNSWQNAYNEGDNNHMANTTINGWILQERMALRMANVMAGSPSGVKNADAGYGGSYHAMSIFKNRNHIFGIMQDFLGDENSASIYASTVNMHHRMFTPWFPGSDATGKHSIQDTMPVGDFDRKYFAYNAFEIMLALYRNSSARITAVSEQSYSQKFTGWIHGSIHPDDIESGEAHNVDEDGYGWIEIKPKDAIQKDDNRLVLFIKNFGLHAFNLAANNLLATLRNKTDLGSDLTGHDTLATTNWVASWNAVYPNIPDPGAGATSWGLIAIAGGYAMQLDKYKQAFASLSSFIYEPAIHRSAALYLHHVSHRLDEAAEKLSRFNSSESQGTVVDGLYTSDISKFIQNMNDPTVLGALINPAQLILSLDASNNAMIELAAGKNEGTNAMYGSVSREMKLLNEIDKTLDVFTYPSERGSETVILSCALPYGVTTVPDIKELDKSIIVINVSMQCESLPGLIFHRRRYFFHPTLFTRSRFKDKSYGTWKNWQADTDKSGQPSDTQWPYYFYDVSKLTSTDFFQIAKQMQNSGQPSTSNKAHNAAAGSGGDQNFNGGDLINHSYALSNAPSIVRQIFHNHLLSHLLGSYIELITGIPIREATFTGDTKLVEQTSGQFKGKFQNAGLLQDFGDDEYWIETVKNILTEHVKTVTNTDVSFEDIVEANKKFIDLETILNKLQGKSPTGKDVEKLEFKLPGVEKQLKMSNDIGNLLLLFGTAPSRLSSATRLLDAILEPKAFERIFHIPLSVTEFMVDKSKTEAYSPKVSLDALVKDSILVKRPIAVDQFAVDPQTTALGQVEFAKDMHYFIDTENVSPIVTFSFDFEFASPTRTMLETTYDLSGYNLNWPPTEEEVPQ